MVYNVLNTLFELVWHIKRRKLIHTKATLCLAEELLIVKLAFQYLFALIDLEPFYALAILPQAVLGRGAWHLVSAEAVLLPTTPVPLVGASI